MYEFIRGTLAHASPLLAIIDCQGVGYKLSIPASAFSKLDTGKEYTLFTSLVIRENAHSLYGFTNREERDLFEVLIGISGVGPKTALGLIGNLDPESLRNAIAEKDVSILSRVPGVGKKTAERLIVEIQDKVPRHFPYLAENFDLPNCKMGNPILRDALSALINLGYKENAAEKALQKVLKENDDSPNLSQLITQSLQRL